eukprot:jgi/Chlat1/8160/Chrsp76S07616
MAGLQASALSVVVAHSPSLKLLTRRLLEAEQQHHLHRRRRFGLRVPASKQRCAAAAALRHRRRAGCACCVGSSAAGDGAESSNDEQPDSLQSAAANAANAVPSSSPADDAAAEAFTSSLDAEPSPSSGQSTSILGDAAFLRRLVASKDADALIAAVDEAVHVEGARVLSSEDCVKLITASLRSGNADLALSMCGVGDGQLQMLQPRQVALVRGLAAALRVRDALTAVSSLRRGGRLSEEVAFGRVVDCPRCKKPLTVVQPQEGRQVAPCCICCYEYELVSGDLTRIESEALSPEAGAWKTVARVLRLRKPAPAAVHSLLLSAPDGMARTFRFATDSSEVPAQEGERVTVAAAAPREATGAMLNRPARAPGLAESEPMSITNHNTGRTLGLSRAPPPSGQQQGPGAAWFPIILALIGTDALSAFVDPTMPRLLASLVVGSIVAAAVGNTFVVPRLNQLSSRSIERGAVRQKLLEQHDALEKRLAELTEAASAEVRTIAKLWQLENKMEAVGQQSYSARIDRVRNARQGLDERLASRLELIDSYAKVAAMIEIEVEMDADVPAAEMTVAVDGITEQITRLMEVESLQQEWQWQAEANEEVERLLRSEPALKESMRAA